MKHLDKYRRTQATTASPEQLMVIAFETAKRHMAAGIDALESGHRSEAVQALTQASEVVSLLASSLDHRHAPELCDHLTSVYQFVSSRLTLSAINRDLEKAREAERAFLPVADAFLEVAGRPGRAP